LRKTSRLPAEISPNSTEPKGNVTEASAALAAISGSFKQINRLPMRNEPPFVRAETEFHRAETASRRDERPSGEVERASGRDPFSSLHRRVRQGERFVLALPASTEA
jgi:hypothetical protein